MIHFQLLLGNTDIAGQFRPFELKEIFSSIFWKVIRLKHIVILKTEYRERLISRVPFRLSVSDEFYG